MLRALLMPTAIPHCECLLLLPIAIAYGYWYCYCLMYLPTAMAHRYCILLMLILPTAIAYCYCPLLVPTDTAYYCCWYCRLLMPIVVNHTRARRTPPPATPLSSTLAIEKGETQSKVWGTITPPHTHTRRDTHPTHLIAARGNIDRRGMGGGLNWSEGGY